MKYSVYEPQRSFKTAFYYKVALVSYILVGLLVGVYLGLQWVAHNILMLVGIK